MGCTEMKSVKKSQLIPIALLFLTFISIYYLFSSRITLAKDYASNVAAARNDADNGVMVKAVEEYSAALSLNPSLELSIEVAEKYLQNGDSRSAKRWYERNVLEEYPTEPKVYEFGMKMLIDEGNYKKAFETYDTFKKRRIKSDVVEELYRSIRYKYKISESFKEAKPFTSSNRAVVSDDEGEWIFINTSGDDASGIYEYAGSFLGGYASVTKDGKSYFIDVSGNTILTPDYFMKANPEQKTITRFGDVQGNFVMAYDGSVWNYYDLNSHRFLFGGYKEATPITNGIGAVTKNGVDWALINSKGEEVTGYDFNSVVTDERGFVCRNDCLIVEKNSYYVLVDRTGKELTSEKYTAAYGFNDNTYAAVEKNGKWLFIDAKGNEIDLGDFEEAHSFSSGLAAVKKDGYWGYIDLKGNIVVDCIFNDAQMISNGIGFVKDDSLKWRMLKFYVKG